MNACQGLKSSVPASMETIPGSGIKVTCKKETAINASGAHIPALFTISLISSFEISVNPNALSIKYAPIINPIIIIADMDNFSIDFLAS